MTELLLHGLGDFIIQNDWMALNKKKLSWKGELACQIHCITYALPFLFITSWVAVLFIYAAHYVIDRSRIIDWFIACRNGKFNIKNFGFGEERPFVITFWLYIITDNLFHLICNHLIIKYLG